MWNHLTNAYGHEYKLYRPTGFTWNDVTHNPDGWPVYLFDESGTDTLYPPAAFQHPTNALYIFGITGMDITAVVPPASRDGVIKITTPNPVSFWGCEAAAIVLAHRYRQLGV
jgi:hypothetical protein